MQISDIKFGEVSHLNKYNIQAQKVKGLTSSNFNANNPIYSQSLSKDVFQPTTDKISSVKNSFNKIQSEQGLIGKAWNGIKNFLGMKSGSKKVSEMIFKYEKGEISKEEAETVIKKYQEGQKMCVDIVGDIVSGIVGVAAFAFAVPTGGTSIAIGLSAATALGAGVKIGIKGADSLVGGRKYTLKDLAYDSATGAINGLMAPVTNGIGASLTKTIGKKLGLTIIENGVTQVAANGVKGGLKSVLLTRYVDVAGGTVLKRAAALGAGMAIDGALSGASDNAVRAAMNGQDVKKAAIEGAIGGAIAAPVIGGGFRLASKAGHTLNNVITTRKVLPDGLATAFKQGEAGDCSLLSILDGILNSKEAAPLIKNAITKTAGGDYNVKIGNQIVHVAKSSLTDEILSDTTGIKIFEQAYKQIAGDLDGGFADVVAKQFGLNPVHITSDALSDEVLDRLAKEQGNAVLSYGTLVDKDGIITSLGGQRHYFSIKNIDPKTKTVKLTSTLDTSQIIDMTYDEVKSLGISIDGGTVVKANNIPNVARNMDDELFRGINVANVKKSFIDKLGASEKEVNTILSKFNGDISADTIASELKLYGISSDEAVDFITTRLNGRQLNDGGIEAFNDFMQAIRLKNEFSKSPLFDFANLSLEEVDSVKKLIRNGNTREIYDVIFSKNENLACVLDENQFYESYQRQLHELIDNSVYKHVAPDDVAELGIFNGRKRYAILPDATSVAKKSIPKGQETVFMNNLIKSNMVTQDIVDSLVEQSDDLSSLIPAFKSTTILTAKGKTNISFDFNPIELIQKAHTNGIDSLSSHEVHALTDIFSNLYSGSNKNPQFQRMVNSLLKSNAGQYNNIYSYVEHLKRLSSGITNKYGIAIEDHAFMRMLDRNLLSVTDNSSFRRLSFNEFIDLISKNAKAGKTNIQGYNSVAGIKLITKTVNGKVVIDTVI